MSLQSTFLIRTMWDNLHYLETGLYPLPKINKLKNTSSACEMAQDVIIFKKGNHPNPYRNCGNAGLLAQTSVMIRTRGNDYSNREIVSSVLHPTSLGHQFKQWGIDAKGPDLCPSLYFYMWRLWGDISEFEGLQVYQAFKIGVRWCFFWWLCTPSIPFKAEVMKMQCKTFRSDGCV